MTVPNFCKGCGGRLQEHEREVCSAQACLGFLRNTKIGMTRRGLSAVLPVERDVPGRVELIALLKQDIGLTMVTDTARHNGLQELLREAERFKYDDCSELVARRTALLGPALTPAEKRGYADTDTIQTLRLWQAAQPQKPGKSVSGNALDSRDFGMGDLVVHVNDPGSKSSIVGKITHVNLAMGTAGVLWANGHRTCPQREWLRHAPPGVLKLQMSSMYGKLGAGSRPNALTIDPETIFMVGDIVNHSDGSKNGLIVSIDPVAPDQKLLRAQIQWPTGARGGAFLQDLTLVPHRSRGTGVPECPYKVGDWIQHQNGAIGCVMSLDGDADRAVEVSWTQQVPGQTLPRAKYRLDVLKPGIPPHNPLVKPDLTFQSYRLVGGACNVRSGPGAEYPVCEVVPVGASVITNGDTRLDSCSVTRWMQIVDPTGKKDGWVAQSQFVVGPMVSAKELQQFVSSNQSRPVLKTAAETAAEQKKRVLAQWIRSLPRGFGSINLQTSMGDLLQVWSGADTQSSADVIAQYLYRRAEEWFSGRSLALEYRVWITLSDGKMYHYDFDLRPIQPF